MVAPACVPHININRCAPSGRIPPAPCRGARIQPGVKSPKGMKPRVMIDMIYTSPNGAAEGFCRPFGAWRCFGRWSGRCIPRLKSCAPSGLNTLLCRRRALHLACKIAMRCYVKNMTALLFRRSVIGFLDNRYISAIRSQTDQVSEEFAAYTGEMYR